MDDLYRTIIKQVNKFRNIDREDIAHDVYISIIEKPLGKQRLYQRIVDVIRAKYGDTSKGRSSKVEINRASNIDDISYTLEDYRPQYSRMPEIEFDVLLAQLKSIVLNDMETNATHKAIFLLRYFGEWSLSELEDVFSINKFTVCAAAENVRKKLIKIIEC